VAKKSSLALVRDDFSPFHGCGTVKVATCCKNTGIPMADVDPEFAAWRILELSAGGDTTILERFIQAGNTTVARVRVALIVGPLLPLSPGVASSKAPPPLVRTAAKAI
jgi:hypothetical protein